MDKPTAKKSSFWQKTTFKIDDVCNLGFLPMSMHVNPVYLTARQILESEAEFDLALAKLAYNETILYEFYKWMNKEGFSHLAHVLKKLSGQEAAGKKMPATACFTPWNMIKHEDVNHFVPAKGKFQSPKSLQKIKYGKFLNLLTSMRKNGYCPTEPNIDPTKAQHGFLTCHYIENSENKRRVFITQGNHRAAVFFALFPDQEITAILDHEKIFKKKRKLMYESPLRNVYKAKWVDSWPSVRKNTLTADGAMQIFNCYFDIGTDNKSPWHEHLYKLSKNMKESGFHLKCLDDRI